jgi:hypothetical protein
MAVFENSDVGKILTEDRDVIAGWRNLHTEKLCNKYYCSTTIGVTKTSSTRCVRHVQSMTGMRNIFLSEKN